MKKAIKWVEEDPKEKNVFWPSKEMKKMAWMSDPSIYEKAEKDPEKFWAELAEKGIDWYEKWDKIYEAKPPHFKWFLKAKLNASYNCVDRHLKERKDKAAIIWEPEPTNEKSRILTYQELYDEVNKFANVLKKLGVKKGDRVGIYLPLIPEVQITMLACARIGAIHSVVFSAFSSESLKKRMDDAEAKVLVTVDGYYRRGKVINLKASADKGVEGTSIEKVVVVKRAGNEITMKEERDCWWDELMEDAEPYYKPEPMDSEDTLFLLYTSGTTGKPKGIVHETGGYLTQAYWTTKWNFDLHDDDVFWCTADIGWVTGHTYACYGPLACGATMVIYEGAPNYPEKDRWWKIVEKFGVTVFYTAPTAIRMLAKWGDEWSEKHDLSTLRLLATVGEPIDQDAWLWYFEHIGGKRCPVIDTWWQTETGGTLINALPGIGPFIPTVAGRSFPGTRHKLLDEEGKSVPQGETGYLVQSPPFAPGMLRNVYKNPQRYKSEYFSEYGDGFYYTSDGAKLIDDENFRLTGRVDDVMKVAGHRLSTAEVENAIATHPAVSECAVIPAPHEIKGQTPVAFVILKHKEEPSEDLTKELVKQVTQVIGPTARPEKIIFVKDLPKTRSGKIMRRILKSLVRNEPTGDLTTLQNPESVEDLKKKTGYKGEN